MQLLKNREFTKRVKQLEKKATERLTFMFPLKVLKIAEYFINIDKNVANKRALLLYTHGYKTLLEFYANLLELNRTGNNLLSMTEMKNLTKAVHTLAVKEDTKDAFLLTNLVKSDVLSEEEEKHILEIIPAESCCKSFVALYKRSGEEKEIFRIKVLNKNVIKTVKETQKRTLDNELENTTQLLYKKEAQCSSVAGQYIHTISSYRFDDYAIELWETLEPIVCAEGVHTGSIASYLHKNKVPDSGIKKLTDLFMGKNTGVISDAPLAGAIREKQQLTEETIKNWVQEIKQYSSEPNLSFKDKRKLYCSVISLLQNPNVTEGKYIKTLIASIYDLPAENKLTVEENLQIKNLHVELEYGLQVKRQKSLEDSLTRLSEKSRIVGEQLLANGYPGWGWDLEETIKAIEKDGLTGEYNPVIKIVASKKDKETNSILPR